jgi:hypothetical protein
LQRPRQLETASHINKWLCSPELQPSKIPELLAEELTFDLDQADMIGVLPSAGMKSTGEKQSRKRPRRRARPSLGDCLKSTLPTCGRIIDKLRRKLN